ncbi:trehalose operon repressor [Virgibacillus phasianinus]|uniref:Trehalose operon repressor n=1 Tax=Virgibacillus phasianinus TaxID=2017483 RepID=A0A220TZ50_9BACI|nr:trehalose operon repressor [Virgibacillus phasianinus]ASK61284.1 trehalose operon repressor [Virgibacillus phasianinus]
MQKKYLTIYQDLVLKIQDNYWPKQTMLPSENELTEMYATSRETIRKALNLLAQDGYIQKIRGKGSMVIDINKFDFPVTGIVSFKELADKLNVTTKTTVHELSLSEVEPRLQNTLQLKRSDKVWTVVRSRDLDGEKVILDKDFLNEKVVPTLTKEICGDSIYSYLENELGLTISFARKEIVVEEPTEEDRQLLDLESFSNVVVIKSLVYLDDARLFQYTESRHRPDKFRFVDFARRVNE